MTIRAIALFRSKPRNDLRFTTILLPKGSTQRSLRSPARRGKKGIDWRRASRRKARGETSIDTSAHETGRRRFPHWLFLALSFLACVSVLLALAAPNAGEAVYRLQSTMCHQRSDRSFHVGGHPLGLCARCMGIYAGLGLAGGIYLLARRSRAYRYAGIASFAGPIGFGIEQAAHFEGHNPVRFAIGIGLGLWLGFVVNWLFGN